MFEFDLTGTLTGDEAHVAEGQVAGRKVQEQADFGREAEAEGLVPAPEPRVRRRRPEH